MTTVHGGHRLRAAAPWIGLALGLGVATAPVWRLAVLGFDPNLDDLLRILCATGP